MPAVTDFLHSLGYWAAENTASSRRRDKALEREGWSLRLKRKAPHPPPGRGAKPRARHIRAAWENGIGPRVNLDVNSQNGGDILAQELPTELPAIDDWGPRPMRSGVRQRSP
jgi:hypothetical protein